MTEISFLMPFVFFAIAFCYSLAGFAGGSSYLLALTLFGVSYSQTPATALLCNLAASAVTFYNFHRAGHFRMGLVLPFVLTSVPAAYLGARVHLPKELFILFLGFSLAVAALRLYGGGSIWRVLPPAGLFRSRPSFCGLRAEENSPSASPAKLVYHQQYAIGLPLGAAIGFLSGLVGVGGGIFLCPALLFMKWARVREASAAAAFFIFVNSLSGLAGHLQKGFTVYPEALAPAVFAFLGAAVGSAIGSRRLSAVGIQRALACLLSAASLQLLARLS